MILMMAMQITVTIFNSKSLNLFDIFLYLEQQLEEPLNTDPLCLLLTREAQKILSLLKFLQRVRRSVKKVSINKRLDK